MFNYSDGANINGRGKRISIWLVIVFVVVALGVGFFIGRQSDKSRSVIKGAENPATTTGILLNKDGQVPDYLTKDVDFNLFWDAWNLIRDKYYEKDIPQTQMFYGALSGLVASLQDPHSVFFTPQDTSDFAKELEGNFEGIGAEIGIRNNSLTVISPLPDSPAMKAGLRAQDVVVQIDGADTAGMALDKAISLIRGKKGTPVKLTVFRKSWPEPKDFEITRDTINVKSVTWEFKNPETVYVKMRQFNDSTVPLFNDAIVDILKRKEVKNIILDLRYNPGGYLQAAIDVASEWVDSQLVVSEKLRSGETIEHKASRVARLAGYKTVVLVDAGTASGSEIVAGALQDWGRAVIIGEKTFGKGSVQELFNLSDDSSLKLTIAKWFTPKGHSIDQNGIEPDIKMEMADEDYNNFRDPQLDRAMAELGK